MRAISIKLKNYAGNVSISSDGALEKRGLRFIFVSFMALALIYVLVLGTMVFNIVERKSLEVRANSLENEVGEMQLTYLELSNKVDLNYSHSLGFKEANAKFAPRKSLGSLSGKVKNEI